MKKIFIVIIAFVILCFAIPIILTKRTAAQVSKEVGINDNTENLAEENKYTYNDYATVKVLYVETGEVKEVNMDEYLYGVVSAEMPANYEMEALKAQAVVARTYTAYKILHTGKHPEADICNDSKCCQAWISKEDRLAKWNEAERESNWNKIVEAVDSTAGKIITYNGEPINAFFHASSGGSTEIVSNVWGGTDYPYLQSVQTSGEEEYSQYASEVTFSKEELLEKLKTAHPEVEIIYEEENPIQITEYTDSGRVKTIKFGNISISGVEARSLLGLRSAKFNVSIGENITFSVTGYGHGVGLSQTGADSMAKSGSNFEQIINHYYTGIKIENI